MCIPVICLSIAMFLLLLLRHYAINLAFSVFIHSFLSLLLCSAELFVYVYLFIIYRKPTETLESSLTCSVCSLFFSLLVTDPSSSTYPAFFYSQFSSFATILYLFRYLRNPCTLLCASIISRALSHSICWLFSLCIINWHFSITPILLMQVYILGNLVFCYG